MTRRAVLILLLAWTAAAEEPLDLEPLATDPGRDARIGKLIDALPDESSEQAFAFLRQRFDVVDRRDPGEAQRMLAALAEVDEERALPVFRAHMAALGRFSRGNVLAALHSGRRPRVARALLPRLLEVQDAVGNLGSVPVPVKGDTRWCDWAAAILARAHPEFAFDQEAPVENRDRQIEAMRTELEKASPSVR